MEFGILVMDVKNEDHVLCHIKNSDCVQLTYAFSRVSKQIIQRIINFNYMYIPILKTQRPLVAENGNI